MITTLDIDKLASRKNVKAIAVQNFLGTLGDMSVTDAWSNLKQDARSYRWNAATVKAIGDGIARHFR